MFWHTGRVVMNMKTLLDETTDKIDGHYLQQTERAQSSPTENPSNEGFSTV